MSAVREIESVYASLPRLACQRKCAQSCGPIFMSRVEWERIIVTLGYEPKAPIFAAAPGSLDCPMLSPIGTCNVYAIRPLICRLWGLVEKMRCPWGCVPERWLTDRVGEIGA